MAKAIEKTTGIKDLRLARTDIKIRGTSELVVERFSTKAREVMEAKHKEGGASKKGKAKEARSFENDYNGARYVSTDGWDGVHASAFRNALISACRLVGVKMTMGKLTLFVIADGVDAEDGTALMRIRNAEPEMFIMPTRNATGVADLRARPRYRAGWEMTIPIEHDLDMFSVADVTALMKRVGRQIGIGAGRHDSKASCGLGWGCFEVVE